MATRDMELIAITIDCSGAVMLADFYTSMVGGEVTYSDAEHGHAQAMVAGTTVNFRRVHGYSPL